MGVDGVAIAIFLPFFPMLQGNATKEYKTLQWLPFEILKVSPLCNQEVWLHPIGGNAHNQNLSHFISLMFLAYPKEMPY